jgi:hypothetical protein
LLKRFAQKLLARAGYLVFNTRSSQTYARDGLYTAHSDHFREDPAFQDAYARGVKAGGGVDPRMEWRVHVALWAAGIAVRTVGDFVECGVNAGFVSSAIMQRLDWARTGRRYYLIDTFSGPVLAQYSTEEIAKGRVAAAKDAIAREAYVTDLKRIRANFAEWPNVEIVQGAVPEVLGGLQIGTVAFLHIDMNCALPERAALEHFWEHLCPGGVVLFDDYTYFGHEEQTGAIDEVVARVGAEVLSLPTGQGLIVK